MTEFQREIKRKKRVIEYAEKNGNIKTACRRFGIARSTFYLWRDRYRESSESEEDVRSRTAAIAPPPARRSRPERLVFPAPSMAAGEANRTWMRMTCHSLMTMRA